MKTRDAGQLTADTFIEIDPEVMGGTPVIRGTRVTVYALLGRVERGDPIEDILYDYPHLKRDAVEAALGYARGHPLVEDPGGRPWAHGR
jgi:uncharacterized protein (DUF433 family)